MALIFADASLNILAAETNVVITSSSPVNLVHNAYQLGSVWMTAPAGTAYVQMLVGLSDPTGTNVAVPGSSGAIGQLEADSAVLSTPAIVSITAPPISGSAPPGQTIPLTVSIPQGFNSNAAIEVMVSNSNPSVVSLPGSTNGLLTLNFAAGATNEQVIDATVAGHGLDTLTVSGTNLAGNPLVVNLTTDTNFLGQVLNAAYAPGLAIDGTGDAWGNLTSDTLYMNTSANNDGANPGTLGSPYGMPGTTQTCIF